MAVDNNLSLKQTRNEIAKGKFAISENQAKLLPQINAVALFNDNFTPPVSVTDGSSYGKLYNVTKTLQYNAAAGVQLQMPLYNQMVNTAIDIAKIADRMNQFSYEKAREDLIVQTAKMYYMVQNTAEQIRLVNDNIKRLEELYGISKAFYDNQMVLEVDVKRVQLNIENLTVQRDKCRQPLVTIKEMAGWTFYGCLGCAILMLVILCRSTLHYPKISFCHRQVDMWKDCF